MTVEEAMENPIFMKQMSVGRNQEATLMYYRDYKPQFESYDDFMRFCFEN